MAFDSVTDPVPATDFSDALPDGTRLLDGDYRITRTLNSGGFGIIYLATDRLDREVVVKECFPANLCFRQGATVQPHLDRSRFDAVLRCFMNEAEVLASLRHDHIVGLHRVFKENGTAYMAIDRLHGSDLLELVEQKSRSFSPAEVVDLATKLIGTLGHLHRNDILHCDISPDNIIITRTGKPVLIDFGAARPNTHGQNGAGSEAGYGGPRVAKDGYSPAEQYLPRPQLTPASDIHALAASLYHLVTGTLPESCDLRAAAVDDGKPDPCKPLVGWIAGYPPGFLDSIDKAMSVAPAARFARAEDWLAAMKGPAPERPVLLMRRANPWVSPPRPAARHAPIDISGLCGINGFLGGWLVDSASGITVASANRDRDMRPDNDLDDGLDDGLAANIAVARASFATTPLVARDGGREDGVEDILISRGSQVHLIRPLKRKPGVFLCVALDKASTSPGLARAAINRVEQSLML